MVKSYIRWRRQKKNHEVILSKGILPSSALLAVHVNFAEPYDQSKGDKPALLKEGLKSN